MNEEKENVQAPESAEIPAGQSPPESPAAARMRQPMIEPLNIVLDPPSQNSGGTDSAKPPEPDPPGPPKPEPRSRKPATTYILLLFVAAFLLMALSSLMHQRSNMELLGQLQRDLPAMQEVQDFQERIIGMQEARQEVEDQLKEVQRNMAALLAQTQEEHNRAEALRYLYRIQMKFLSERYQSCQLIIEEFEASGLVDSLPQETADSDVVSPMERFRQLKEANAARVAETLIPQPPEPVEPIEPAEPNPPTEPSKPAAPPTPPEAPEA